MASNLYDHPARVMLSELAIWTLPLGPVSLTSLQFPGIQVNTCTGPCLTCSVPPWEEGDTFQMKVFILRSNSTNNPVLLLLFRKAETNLSGSGDGKQG